MIFHYAGKFKDEHALPKREHPEGAVQYKEPKSMAKFAVIANAISIAILLVLTQVVFIRAKDFVINNDFWDYYTPYLIGMGLAIVASIPHEFLHAICFKKDVYMYQALQKGLLFVIGTEDMSKSKFIFMSLLPNLVFGFIPFIIFLFFPNLIVLGAMGAMAIGGGAGDYFNVFNTIFQVPNGAKIYMSGMHTYWYKPEK
mgnify:FL=1